MKLREAVDVLEKFIRVPAKKNRELDTAWKKMKSELAERVRQEEKMDEEMIEMVKWELREREKEARYWF